MLKGAPGIVLALICLVGVMELAERMGLLVGFLALAAWCFTCQFVHSRGDVDAHRGHWPGMLLVAALPTACVVLMILLERREVIQAQAPGTLIAVFGGTYAGAFSAAMLARRAVARSQQ